MTDEKRELVITLALALMAGPKSKPILGLTENGEIDVDLPRLADALLADGYRRGMS